MIGGALTLYAWRAPLLKSQRRLRARRARVLPAVQQRAAGDRRRDGVRRHAGAADLRHARARHALGRPAVLQSDLPAARCCRCWRCCRVGIHASWKRGRLGDQPAHAPLHAAWPPRCSAAALAFGIYSHGQVLTPVGATLGIWIILSSLVDPIDRWRRGLTLPRARARHDDRAHRPGDRASSAHHRAVLHGRAGRRAGARRRARASAATSSASRA